MTQRKLDFLSRRPVQATMFVSLDAGESRVANHLPDGYLLDHGKFRFPAGYWESYFVNGKEYNAEGNRTVDEQRELISKDLTEEGFSQEELEEFMAEIEMKEGRMMLLTPEASNKWLKYHPEFESEALHLLSRIKNEIRSETTREIRGGMKRK